MYAITTDGGLFSLVDGSQAPIQNVTAVAAAPLGSATTCVLTGDAQLQCWGDNNLGQVGDGTTTTRTTPVTVDTGYSAVTMSLTNTCGLLLDGTVKCWGAGFGSGKCQVAGIPVACTTTPTLVAGLTNVVELPYTYAALLADGSVVTVNLSGVPSVQPLYTPSP